MEFKAGQWWRTRDGKRSFVAGISLHGEIIAELEGGVILRLTKDGSRLNGDEPYLVEHLPWCTSFDCPDPKPARKEGWINFYVNGQEGSFYDTKAEAKMAGSDTQFQTVYMREAYSVDELKKIALEIDNFVTTDPVISLLIKYFGEPKE